MSEKHEGRGARYKRNKAQQLRDRFAPGSPFTSVWVGDELNEDAAPLLDGPALARAQEGDARYHKWLFEDPTRLHAIRRGRIGASGA